MGLFLYIRAERPLLVCLLITYWREYPPERTALHLIYKALAASTASASTRLLRSSFCVTLHFFPNYGMKLHRIQHSHPEVFVFYRLFVSFLPAFSLPVVNPPFGEGIDNQCTVTADGD